MPQVRYTSHGRAKIVGLAVSGKTEKDVGIVTRMIRNHGTAPTVLVVELQPGVHVVLSDGGAGTWTEQ